MDSRTHTALAATVCRIARDHHADLTDAAVHEIVDATRQTDFFEDLEIVDVESAAAWALGGTGRDDPHADDRAIGLGSEDRARSKPWGRNITSLDHFIDIGKGAGRFDDFDGYGFRRGSAGATGFQTIDDYLIHDLLGGTGGLCDLIGRALEAVHGAIGGDVTVDAGLNYWFNDEYVHAPGHPWYRGCSPAAERYYYRDSGSAYASLESESAARFPLAQWRGNPKCGIPYSVFMPEDNLARYWYDDFVAHKSWSSLGPVLHAVMDQSIPHHAAGVCGNWHARYEHTLGDHVESWLGGVEDDVRRLLDDWAGVDPHPPTALGPGDMSRVPASNWRIDQLVTWMALQSYDAYVNVYAAFGRGFRFDDSSARRLLTLATAMSVHIVRLATVRNTTG